MVLIAVEIAQVDFVLIASAALIATMLTLHLNAQDGTAGLNHVANVLPNTRVVEMLMPNSTTLMVPMILVSGKSTP